MRPDGKGPGVLRASRGDAALDPVMVYLLFVATVGKDMLKILVVMLTLSQLRRFRVGSIAEIIRARGGE